MRIRPERVAQRMRREVAEILDRRLRDPRLAGRVSVTDVEITADLSSARIFVGVLAEGREREQAMAALEAATGFVRRELGARLGLREVPEIRFLLDTSLERGARVEELLRRLHEGGVAGDDEGS